MKSYREMTKEELTSLQLELQKAFEDAKLETESGDLVYLPVTTVPINDAELGAKLLKLVERLDELEDVKEVYTNYELDPSLNLED